MKKSTMFEAVFRNTNVIFGETWENHGKTLRKPSHQKRRIAVQQAKSMFQTQNDAIYAADTINVNPGSPLFRLGDEVEVTFMGM